MSENNNEERPKGSGREPLGKNPSDLGNKSDSSGNPKPTVVRKPVKTDEKK